MRVHDIHVHLASKTTAADVERFLEQAELAATVLISQDPADSDDGGKRHIEELADLRAKLGERVYAFARLDPMHAKAPELLEYAVRECGFAGLKMLPQTFHPANSCARNMYTVVGCLNVPLLMHTGILWLPGNNTDNCRPGNMDVMSEYPDVRFAMAHIGWPWTDECIALAQKLRVLSHAPSTAYVDLTPGTPPSYRQSALLKCIENVHAEYMLFGSDASLPTEGRYEPMWRQDKAIFDRLGVPEKEQEMIFSGNSLRFLFGQGKSVA